MSEGLDGCSHVIDTHGLHAIAALKGNSKATFKAALKSGEIAVPAMVWKEFQELYEDEAADLAPFVTTKLRMKTAYHIGAASIEEGSGVRFLQSSYDTHADLCTAAICQIEGRTLLTSELQLTYYEKLNCCSTTDTGEWLANQ
jgi:hypothetical protein